MQYDSFTKIKSLISKKKHVAAKAAILKSFLAKRQYAELLDILHWILVLALKLLLCFERNQVDKVHQIHIDHKEKFNHREREIIKHHRIINEMKTN